MILPGLLAVMRSNANKLGDYGPFLSISIIKITLAISTHTTLQLILVRNILSHVLALAYIARNFLLLLFRHDRPSSALQ
jgi:hypothetical protein